MSVAIPLLTSTRSELFQALGNALLTTTGSRAVVMTMGALHEGHLDLLREAARLVGPDGTVVVTIFVNPLQFAQNEDLAAYPRDLEGDIAKLSATARDSGLGHLIVFAPTPDVIYPEGDPTVRIDPGPLATVLEGAVRPAHFAGVCQVVLKLLMLTRPDFALFGRKDAQQLAIVRAMVRDFDLPVTIVPVEIRRESDGLAMSSRNAYLSPSERQDALVLSRALAVGRESALTGASPEQVVAAARGVIDGVSTATADYVALVDPETFVDLAGAGLGLDPVTQGKQDGGSDGGVLAGAAGSHVGVGVTTVGPRRALLALAVRIGSTRLIDNALIDVLV